MLHTLEDPKQESSILIRCFKQYVKSHPMDIQGFSGFVRRTLSRSGLSVKIQSQLMKTLGGLEDYLARFDRPDGTFFPEYVQFCLDESRDFADRLRDYSEICGVIWDSAEHADQLLVLFFLSLNSKLISEFKYWANLVFTKHFDNLEQPLCSGVLGTFLVTRRLRVFLNRIKTPKKRLQPKNLCLMYSLFQGLKKGFMPGRPDMIDKSLLGHKKALVDKDPNVSDDILDCCDRVATELFHSDNGFTVPSMFSNFHLFSRNSTIDSNYMNGGLLGALRDLAAEEERNGCVADDFLVGMVEKGLRVIEVRTNLFSFGTLVSQRTKFQREEFFKKPSAQPYCIIEPMKIRIITKPSTFQHFGVKSVQKAMWRHLFGHKSNIFSLIGSTVDECQIAEILAAWRPGRKFCSGDYSGATDNLKGAVTERITKVILGGADPITYQWCWRTLAPSIIKYSRCHPKYGNILDNWNYQYESLGEQEQRNGQLMGSILSFVILCVANLAAYVHSLETFHNRQFRVEDLVGEYAVKVNGDDILFCSEESFYNHWRQVIQLFGFEPSIGKNLFSDEILQINSALFMPKYMDVDKDIQHRVLPSKRCIGAYWVPYVNYGLVTTRKKQDCSKDTRLISGIGVGRDLTQHDLDGINRLKVLKKIQDTLLEGLPSSLLPIVNRQFWSFSKYLQKTFSRIPFFESEEWGGIGLSRVGITDLEPKNLIYDQGVSVKDYLFRAENLTAGDLVLREYYCSQFPEAILLEPEYDVLAMYSKYCKSHRGIYCPRPERPQPVKELHGLGLKSESYLICDL